MVRYSYHFFQSLLLDYLYPADNSKKESKRNHLPKNEESFLAQKLFLLKRNHSKSDSFYKGITFMPKNYSFLKNTQILNIIPLVSRYTKRKWRTMWPSPIGPPTIVHNSSGRHFQIKVPF